MRSLNTADAVEDLSPLLARVIEKVTGALPDEMKCDRRCSYPTLGRWIDHCDYAFLMTTLQLDDSVFEHVYPELQFAEEERRELADEFDAHCDDCEACGAKRAADLVLKDELDRAFANDRRGLRKAIAETVENNSSTKSPRQSSPTRR